MCSMQGPKQQVAPIKSNQHAPINRRRKPPCGCHETQHVAATMQDQCLRTKINPCNMLMHRRKITSQLRLHRKCAPSHGNRIQLQYRQCMFIRSQTLLDHISTSEIKLIRPRQTLHKSYKSNRRASLVGPCLATHMQTCIRTQEQA